MVLNLDALFLFCLGREDRRREKWEKIEKNNKILSRYMNNKAEEKKKE